MEEILCVNKKVFSDIIEDLQLMIESLELMNNSEFMKSYKKAKDEIKMGDVVSFNGLWNFFFEAIWKWF